MDLEKLQRLNEMGAHSAEVLGDKIGAVKIFREALSGHTQCNDKDCECAVVKHNLACQLFSDELQEYKEATELFFECADKYHYPSAMYYAGCIYVKQNDIAALGYFRRAATMGHQGAKRYLLENMGPNYLQRNGIPE